MSVYFAACLGPFGQPIGAYKIGHSANIESRMRSVASTLPFSLECVATVPGGYFMETLIHLYLKDHRIRGEYFRVNDATDTFIRKAVERGQAFNYIQDEGLSDWFDLAQKAKLRDAFLRYHKVRLEEAADYLGSSIDRCRTDGHAMKVICAAAIVAQRRPYPQTSNFHVDIIRALLGEVHWAVRRKAIAAPVLA